MWQKCSCGYVHCVTSAKSAAFAAQRTAGADLEGVSRVSGHLPFCLECPFLKIINFQNVVYFHYA